MSDFFSVSAVDRREESIQHHQSAHSNVGQALPGHELDAQEETQGNAEQGKQRKRKGKMVDKDRIVPTEDPDAHSFDVTV